MKFWKPSRALVGELYDLASGARPPGSGARATATRSPWSFTRFVDVRVSARATGTPLAASSRTPAQRAQPTTIQTPYGRVANRDADDFAVGSVSARPGSDRRAGVPPLPHLVGGAFSVPSSYRRRPPSPSASPRESAARPRTRKDGAAPRSAHPRSSPAAAPS